MSYKEFMILVRLQMIIYIHSTPYSINYTHHTHAYGIWKKSVFVLIYRLISLQRLFWIFMNKLLSRMQIFIPTARAHKIKLCTQINLENFKAPTSRSWFLCTVSSKHLLLLFVCLLVCMFVFAMLRSFFHFDYMSAAKKK